MANNPSYEELVAEARKRGLPLSSESVLEEPSTTLQEVGKFTESLGKGAARGIIDLFGGWGNLYDRFYNKSGTPSALSSAGMVGAIDKATGVDLGQIKGYRGAYEFGQAAGPQTAISLAFPQMALAPQLMQRSRALGSTVEALTAGGTSMAAQQIAPDSPLAQFALQSAPYVVSGAGQAYRGSLTKPKGVVDPAARELLDVGPLTPGEATGSRRQLQTEATTEASASIEHKATKFRQEQATSVKSFLDNVFNRASSQATTPEKVTSTVFNAFDNFGKNLSKRLTSDARKDFNAAKNSGGKVDTTPVVSAAKEYVNGLYAETPGLDVLRSRLNTILDEYVTPEQPATSVPSMVLDAQGNPAFTVDTAAVPAKITEISIDRLQKNLSAWGEAAYSGKADFGKGNIFEGVAPGQVKGVARAILGGFVKSLDQAIDQGVPGAAQLKNARDKFKANLASIEEFSVAPLTRAFDVPNVSALTPETIVDKLKKAKPSERAFLGRVLQNNPEAAAVWDTARRSYFDDILNAAINRKAAKNEPNFMFGSALEALNKEGNFGFLFPDAADLADVRKAIRYMQTVEQSVAGGSSLLSASKAYESARAVGATSQGGNLAKTMVDFVNNIVASPNQFANVIFDKDAVEKLARLQERTTPEKLADATKALMGVTARTAARTGPRVSGVGSEQLEAIDPNSVPQDTQDEYNALEEEARRRGLIK